MTTKKFVRKKLPIIIVYLALFFAAWRFGEWHFELKQIIAHKEAEAAVSQTKTNQLRQLKPQVSDLQFSIASIDTELPGVSTASIEAKFDMLKQAVLGSDIEMVATTLSSIDESVAEVLQHQEEVVELELERLLQIIHTNQHEIKLLLADTSLIPEDYGEQLYDEGVDIYVRLDQARTWIETSAAELGRRKEELDNLQKRILIDQSEKRLWMFENDKEIFSMALSLGRPGAATRVGEFEILDKLGTVWSVWDIWLPYWLGIYYAGATENGIHGLPYDDAGNTYWATSIGRQNITFGCVMPTDDDMKILYEWAEVGVPVSIVY